MIKEFRNNYYFLSNFFGCKVIFDGYTYSNVEAAFQAQKNHDKAYKRDMKFMTPGEAKRAGRRVKLRPDWEEVKDDLMYQIVKAKFEQNKDLKDKLLATGDEYLQEGNDWHDNYWGVCTCNRSKCRDTVARNNLGKILMKVRRELKNIANEKEE